MGLLIIIRVACGLLLGAGLMYIFTKTTFSKDLLVTITFFTSLIILIIIEIIQFKLKDTDID